MWNSGQTTSSICTSSGGWHVVVVTDALGCTTADSVYLYSVVGQISTDDDVICLGDTATITVTAAGLLQPIGSNYALTYLPDGNGASYQVGVTVNDQPIGSTFSSANDELQICLNIEHSFMGDLEIKIICPNGQDAVLKEFPGGGGTYLGGAIDNNSGPGVGVDYCFSDNASFGTMVAENVAGNWVTAGTPASISMPGGVYTPFESLANLDGCPLNGTWTLEVTDNQSIDDGYVTFWGLGMYVAATQVSYLWSTGSTANSILVAPQQTTSYSVDVTTDLFTCPASQEIIVNALPEVNFSMNPSDCYLGNGILGFFLSNGDTLQIYNLLGIEVGPNGLDAGLYDVTIIDQDGCSVDTLVEVTLDVDSMDMVYGATIVFPGDQYTYSVGSSECLTYQWAIVNGTILSGQDTHTVTVSWNPGVSGTISVSVQETREFSRSLSLEVLMFNGIDDINGQQLAMYPNPAQGGVHVQVPTKARSYAFISSDGRVIAHGTLPYNSTGSQWLPIPANANGIIGLMIVSDDGIRTGRVSVVH